MHNLLFTRKYTCSVYHLLLHYQEVKIAYELFSIALFLCSIVFRNGA